MSDRPAPLLNIQHLRVRFAQHFRAGVEVVKGLSLAIHERECVALVGESGSGKSVTATSILQLLPRTAHIDVDSRIEFAGRDLLRLSARELQSLRGKDISMVFQDPMSSLNPVFTIGAQLIELLRLHLRMSTAAARSRAEELLTEVGISEPRQRLNAYPHELSGGQQQRVMIAMAIACRPRLLIADEPTTALDVTVQQQIIELLKRLQQQHGMAVLFITHDLGLVKEIAQRVVVMQHGVVCETNATAELFAQPTHPYTQALVACRPQLQRRPRRLPVVDDFLQGRSVDAGERQRGTTPQDDIVLEAKNLQKTFWLRTGLWRRQPLQAVAEVSFRLPRGKTLGIVGESGSGKSTTAMLVMHLTPASGGELWFDGRDVLRATAADWLTLRRRIQIVFQNPFASLNPRFTVAELLLEPLRIHRLGNDDTERLQMARDMLERVGLPATSLARYPHEFSGGQRQRIAIARCLVLRPEVLILDEAVSALDVSVQAQVLNLLTDLQDEFGLSYLFISHDLAVVKHMSDAVLVMQHGRVVETNDADALYRSPQTDYTRTLLAAIPGR